MKPDVRSRVAPAVSAATAAGLLALGLWLLPGCGKPPPINDDKEAGRDKGKPWEVAGKRLRKDAEAGSVRAALAGLTSDLPHAPPGVPRPAELTTDAADKLAALVPLSPDDRAEVGPAAFSAHDPVYLAECLLFRDAARSLDVPPRPGQSPEQADADRADLAWAWVCRQVYLNPWVVETPDGLVATALPPTQVLRRGYGSGLERMYVFLALLRQSGLDGCLVGPPDAGGKPAGFVAVGADGKTVLTGSPRGPFWAAGVRVGNDVRLYDPWRGAPFPAPLSALRANPDAHKGWFEAKENASGVTADDARAAAVFLAVPVNSLSPRMAVLEEQLKADLGARVATDPAALRAAFPDPKPAFWNPPADRFAYGRAARTFLPAEDGGADRTPSGQGRLYDLFLRAQLPREVFRPPAELRDSEAAATRLIGATAGTYLGAFFNPPNPRERIARGQFQDAARDLVARQDQFSQGRERLRNNRAEAQVKAWAERERELENELGLAAIRGTPAERAAAEAALDAHWRAGGPILQLLVDRVSADVGLAEATLLLARCKHEQAERVQARLERAAGPDADALRKDAADAWRVARDEWRTYAERSPAQAGFPGRAAWVQALTARAEGFGSGK
jgi:hypothetical protein